MDTNIWDYCTLCGRAYGTANVHGHGYCVPRLGFTDSLTLDDIRRVVREEIREAIEGAKVCTR